MLLKLIYKEVLHSKLNFLLTLLAMILAVAFFIAFFTANEASKRETIRLTRDMGFNLRIIPKETDMNEFWTTGYSQHSIPEEYIDRFWEFKDFSFAHLTATLHRMILLHDQKVILTGIAPEIEPSGKKKTSMIFEVEPGTVYVGYEVAKSMRLFEGGSMEILGRKFNIRKTLSETGSSDDIRIYGTLSDIQELLGMKGLVNEIMALNCLCLSPDGNETLVLIRRQLEEVLPEANVIMNTTIASARESQRYMLEKYFALVTIFVVIIIAVWIGILVMLNVRRRQTEIGIMNAVGHSWVKIAALFLLKLLFIGIIGACIGFALGTWLAVKFGTDIFKVTSGMIKPIYGLLGMALILAPLFSSLIAFIPVIIAVSKDPNTILRKE
jgi:ABC-type lipoprotein release transport system permease subunit